MKNQKSYSLRTLDVLRILSTKEAEIFIKFGTLAIQSNGIVFLLNFNGGKILEEEYQLNFNERLLLEELGLLATNDLHFKIPKTDSTSRKDVFKIGQELLQLVSKSPKEYYLQLLATKLNRQNGTVKYASILE